MLLHGDILSLLLFLLCLSCVCLPSFVFGVTITSDSAVFQPSRSQSPQFLLSFLPIQDIPPGSVGFKLEVFVPWISSPNDQLPPGSRSGIQYFPDPRLITALESPHRHPRLME